MWSAIKYKQVYFEVGFPVTKNKHIFNTMLGKVLFNMWKPRENIVHSDIMCLPAWPKMASSLWSGDTARETESGS